MNTGLKSFLLAILVFFNAFLIFAIQPIFARDLLPLFGGSAGVWNVSCFVFQLLLLAGYIYAHKIYNHLKIHILMLLVSLFTLPFALNIIDTGIPTLSIICILLSSVGFIYFLLSSTAPLVQRISNLENPYVLYSASNFGALAALVSFPIFIEPLMSRSVQKGLLSIIAGLVILALIALMFIKRNEKHNVTNDSHPETRNFKQSLWWILLAFIPSSLMLGLTEYISFEMFVLPLFWIIPLALYFLSFVISFSRGRRNFWQWPLFILVPILFLTMQSIDNHGTEGLYGFAIIAVHLAAFFYIALVLHTKLAKSAPAKRDLTWFYVCLSIGGALGGFFNSVVSPLIFSSYIEYPIVLILALIFIADTNIKKWISFGVVILCVLIQVSRNSDDPKYTKIINNRNFYGVTRVFENSYYTEMFMTRTALHGIQIKTSPKNPTVYYKQNSPSDIFMNVYANRFRDKNIALVGLGGGALLCYATPGQNWDVFDVNPYMFSVSGRHGTKFTYFDLCTPNAHEYIGDGRLEIAKQPDGKYDLIIIDVFHGFSIPSHMLTSEAFQMYLSKLAPGGILLFHMNMSGMDLMPVVGAHVSATGTYAKYMRPNLFEESGMIQTWLAVSKSPLDLLENWYTVPTDKKLNWTDDFAPIWPVLIF